jgi:hypothetical protein
VGGSTANIVREKTYNNIPQSMRERLEDITRVVSMAMDDDIFLP